MDAKKSLYIYIIGNREITRKKFFENTKGSALFFEARVGGLRTNPLTREQVHEELCAVCGREPETMRHVVTKCKGSRPVLSEEDIQLTEVLGCKVKGKVNWKAVEVSKRKFKCWWENSREEARTTSQQRSQTSTTPPCATPPVTKGKPIKITVIRMALAAGRGVASMRSKLTSVWTNSRS